QRKSLRSDISNTCTLTNTCLDRFEFKLAIYLPTNATLDGLSLTVTVVVDSETITVPSCDNNCLMVFSKSFQTESVAFKLLYCAAELSSIMACTVPPVFEL